MSFPQWFSGSQFVVFHFLGDFMPINIYVVLPGFGLYFVCQVPFVRSPVVPVLEALDLVKEVPHVD